MASVNALLLDEAIDHAIDLRHYSNGVLRRVIGELNKQDVRLSAALAEALLRMEPDSFTVERLEALLSSVRAINAEAYQVAFQALTPGLQGMAQAEVAAQLAMLSRAVPPVVLLRQPLARIAWEQVYAAAMSRPFQGRLLSGWAANVEASRMALIRNAVRTGYMDGRTSAEIIRNIRGTRAKGYADGLLDRPRRELAAVVQTALSHTAQTARTEFARANAGLIKARKWAATLDSKTTPACMIRDGLQYTNDERPKPIGHTIPWLQGPGRLHFNCRSVDVPVTKSWRELGIDIDDMPAGTRASMDGQVPADTTYGEWLARQSAGRQDEILGPARAKLFRAGKVTFDRFFDDKGRFLTLAELLARIGA